MKRLILGCMVAAAILLASSVGVSTADDSLVLYLTFDEDQGNTVVDVSPHQNDGLAVGAPERVEGIFGEALHFNGLLDHVKVPHHDSLNMTDAVTLEMWVKLDSDGGTDSEVGLEKGGWEPGEYSLYALYVPGNASAMQFADLPEACGDANSGHLGQDLRDDTWHHLAGVWNGDEIFLYTDGILDVSVECSGKLGANTQGVFIGARTGTARYLKGALDEIRIYSRALTEAEVNTDMETLGGLPVSPQERLAIRWAEIKQSL